MAYQQVTAEQFLKKAGFDPEQVIYREKIEHFIRERDLDNYIFDMIPADVLRKYAEKLMNDELISYDHLFEEMAVVEKDTGVLTGLTHLAIAQMQNGITTSFLVDFHLRRVYFSSHRYIINDICYAEKAIQMTDEMIAEIMNDLIAAELPNSGKEYRGNTAYRYYTVMQLVFEDGIIKYVSRGLDSDMPSAIAEVCKRLILKFAHYE